MNDLYLFNNGLNYQSYRCLGSRLTEHGADFAVWAPHAQAVYVTGDFDDWSGQQYALRPQGSTGVWQGSVPGAKVWQRYKYAVKGADGSMVLKMDPMARHQETRPGTASILYNPEDYTWQDQAWLDRRNQQAIEPLNIYEVHLGSWRRYPDGSCYNYQAIAPQLAEYCVDMGYTAVELMPLTEYPLDDSWGYQVTGYFSPTSRYGTPADFKAMIDCLHQHGLAVILDWVPAHFPKDQFALACFDGSPQYEYADPDLAEHKDWGTLVFDYNKMEVRSFLISSAWLWIAEFHLDGLRVDAVSSMIYLNYGRDGSLRNRLGGLENLEALDFLKTLNSVLRRAFPNILMIAEESSDFPDVTVSPEQGGLGFSHKWNMGWMHDTLDYMSLDYIYRRDHHHQLTFSMTYAFREHYILPFSHDEVVHGKLSLLNRMPGDLWRKFACYRAMLTYQITHPGAKLNFMGYELGEFIEWRYYEELEWFMLSYPRHQQTQNYVRRINHLYKAQTALWEIDESWAGFEWLQADDADNSVYIYARKGRQAENLLICIFNLTPKSFPEYAFKVPQNGRYRIILNSDESRYGGSDYLGAESEGRLLTTAISLTESGPATDQARRQPLPGPATKTRPDADRKPAGGLIKMPLPPLAAVLLQFIP
ncbi:1,4-alpha-glucan branching protein GlgB [Oscillospiraceae bacterium HV4-5-C5C]|nr:1,4-alpha-glucan branching protein GlgB [Oscillospiraceae bacterium HV4-5-C5C]